MKVILKADGIRLAKTLAEGGGAVTMIPAHAPQIGEVLGLTNKVLVHHIM